VTENSGSNNSFPLRSDGSLDGEGMTPEEYAEMVDRYCRMQQERCDRRSAKIRMWVQAQHFVSPEKLPDIIWRMRILGVKPPPIDPA